jgi:hypothetical protein
MSAPAQPESVPLWADLLTGGSLIFLILWSLIA